MEALAPFARREVWPAPKVDDSGAARLASSHPSPIGEAGGSAGAAKQATPMRGRLRPGRVLTIAGLSAGAIVAAILVTGVGRQKPRQVTHGADTPGATSLASRDRPPMPAGAALTSNVVSPSQTTSLSPSPPMGAGGSGAIRPVRRHAAQPAPTSSPSSSTAPVAPGARPPVAPIGFDPQNPYE